jgi:hypothetical protein
VKLNKFFFEVNGAFEVESLDGCNLLKLIINPDTKGIQKAAAAENDWLGLEEHTPVLR